MNLLRSTTLAAGVAALSLAAVSPAIAKGGGGGDINNTVVTVSPTAPAPVTSTGGGGGGGGSNRPTKCAMIGFDQVTDLIAVCSNAGGWPRGAERPATAGRARQDAAPSAPTSRRWVGRAAMAK